MMYWMKWALLCKLSDGIVTRAGLGSFVAEVSREELKAEKIEEIRGEIGRIVKTGEKFGITPDDVIKIVREHKE